MADNQNYGLDAEQQKVLSKLIEGYEPYETKTTNTDNSKCQKQIEYEEQGIGMVLEQVVMETDAIKKSDSAILTVFINGKMVRKVDLITKKILLNESRYEPYSFLRGFQPDIVDQLRGSSSIPIDYIWNQIEETENIQKTQPLAQAQQQSS